MRGPGRLSMPCWELLHAEARFQCRGIAVARLYQKGLEGLELAFRRHAAPAPPRTRAAKVPAVHVNDAFHCHRDKHFVSQQREGRRFNVLQLTYDSRRDIVCQPCGLRHSLGEGSSHATIYQPITDAFKNRFGNSRGAVGPTVRHRPSDL
jgi:hypothetical protein